MSRIININNAARVRNQNLRTIAELMRRLGARSAVDAEAKDMVAALVYLLREINQSAEKTTQAWEKRGYWMKADRFLLEWEWAKEAAANLEDVLRHEAWDLLPRLLADLLPHAADQQVKNLTRTESAWKGAYQRLLAEPPGELPF
jgi:leucyl-tRNA synthetase